MFQIDKKLLKLQELLLIQELLEQFIFNECGKITHTFIKICQAIFQNFQNKIKQNKHIQQTLQQAISFGI